MSDNDLVIDPRTPEEREEARVTKEIGNSLAHALYADDPAAERADAFRSVNRLPRELHRKVFGLDQWLP